MAVRPIDANALHAEISKWPKSVMYKDWVQSAIANAPTLTPQNEPLTINELLDMNGIPLWLVDTTNNRSEWCYWKNGLAYSCEDYPEHYDPDDYGRWLAYRRPPEGEEDI